MVSGISTFLQPEEPSSQRLADEGRTTVGLPLRHPPQLWCMTSDIRCLLDVGGYDLNRGAIISHGDPDNSR